MTGVIPMWDALWRPYDGVREWSRCEGRRLAPVTRMLGDLGQGLYPRMVVEEVNRRLLVRLKESAGMYVVVACYYYHLHGRLDSKLSGTYPT